MTVRKPRSPRSAAHQSEYHKQWRKTDHGRAVLVAAGRRWSERFPERLRAHRVVGNALRTKQLVRGPCELAGVECRGRVEAHHDDYTKPLEVRWLCKRHHRAADQARRRPAVIEKLDGMDGAAPSICRGGARRFVETTQIEQRADASGGGR